jgi:hypothetical protein
MTCSRADAARERVANHCPHRCAVREKRRLCVERRCEIVSWSLEAKRAQGEAKRVIDLLEDLSCPRKRIGEVFSHSRLLRSLAGEKKYDVHWFRSG